MQIIASGAVFSHNVVVMTVACNGRRGFYTALIQVLKAPGEHKFVIMCLNKSVIGESELYRQRRSLILLSVALCHYADYYILL